jgi:hypothetical protein
MTDYSGETDRQAAVVLPCGWAWRAFAGVPDAPASVLRVEIEADARAHDHREHTEIDYVLECAAGEPTADALAVPGWLREMRARGVR